MFNKFKKLDIIIILVNLILACLIFVMFSGGNGNVVKISVSGDLYGTYSLFKNENIIVETEKGSMEVVINNSVVYVKYSDCNDDECVKQKAIYRKGQSIVCLPLETVIEIGDDNYELAF